VSRAAGDRGRTSCDTAWTGLVSFLKDLYGAPKSQEGNTVRGRSGDTAVSATVEEDEFCDIAAALTAAGPP